MKLLYIDASAGASGDMLAGAMLDLGWPLAELENLISLMGLGHEVRVGVDNPVHHGIRTSRLRVDLPGHDHKHDHDHSHDHKHHHSHDNCHIHHADDAHGHSQSGHEHIHDHEHRGLSQIISILNALPAHISEPAIKVFDNLAAAEARAHGITKEEVHFHEVGAVDAIVDIVAFCAALAWLKADKVVCSPLPLGRGFVNCAHGCLPLPAPAVLNLLENVPITGWPEEEETVTPTGAALLCTLADEFGSMPAFILHAGGIGGGSRPSKGRANLLRVVVGESKEAALDQVAELSCNIDDQLGEDFPFISESLMAAGALDVSACPLLMKKGRPALRIDVLCQVADIQPMCAMLLKLSTSLGVRVAIKERYILPREIISVKTPWGRVRVKTATASDDAKRYHPEADDVIEICRRTGLSPQVVRQKIYALL